jgi:hypothetical protein
MIELIIGGFIAWFGGGAVAGIASSAASMRSVISAKKFAEKAAKQKAHLMDNEAG